MSKRLQKQKLQVRKYFCLTAGGNREKQLEKIRIPEKTDIGRWRRIRQKTDEGDVAYIYIYIYTYNVCACVWKYWLDHGSQISVPALGKFRRRRAWHSATRSTARGGGFQSDRGTPMAGWFTCRKILFKWMIFAVMQLDLLHFSCLKDLCQYDEYNYSMYYPCRQR